MEADPAWQQVDNSQKTQANSQSDAVVGNNAAPGSGNNLLGQPERRGRSSGSDTAQDTNAAPEATLLNKPERLGRSSGGDTAQDTDAAPEAVLQSKPERRVHRLGAAKEATSGVSAIPTVRCLALHSLATRGWDQKHATDSVMIRNTQQVRSGALHRTPGQEPRALLAGARSNELCWQVRARTPADEEPP